MSLLYRASIFSSKYFLCSTFDWSKRKDVGDVDIYIDIGELLVLWTGEILTQQENFNAVFRLGASNSENTKEK